MMKNATSKEKSCLFLDYLKEKLLQQLTDRKRLRIMNALSVNVLMCETEKLLIYVSFLFTHSVKEIKFTYKKLNLKKMLHR